MQKPAAGECELVTPGLLPSSPGQTATLKHIENHPTLFLLQDGRALYCDVLSALLASLPVGSW